MLRWSRSRPCVSHYVWSNSIVKVMHFSECWHIAVIKKCLGRMHLFWAIFILQNLHIYVQTWQMLFDIYTKQGYTNVYLEHKQDTRKTSICRFVPAQNRLRHKVPHLYCGAYYKQFLLRLHDDIEMQWSICHKNDDLVKQVFTICDSHAFISNSATIFILYWQNNHSKAVNT